MKNLIRQNRFTQEELLVDETIFSLANGYIGTRGTFTEGYGTNYEYNQTYINAYYDYYDYTYEENLSGFPQKGQRNINVIDGTKIEFLINNKALNLHNAELVSLKREYDFNQGITVRKANYKYLDFDFLITEQRLVSKSYKGVIAINVKLESPNYKGSVQIKSYLKDSQKVSKQGKDPRIQEDDYKSEFKVLYPRESTIHVKTNESNLNLLTTMMHSIDLGCYQVQQDLVSTKYHMLQDDNPIELSKYIVYTTDLYEEEFEAAHKNVVKELNTVSFSDLILMEKTSSKAFWDKALIQLDGNEHVENLINYNIYQLNSSGGEDEKHNIAAKGLSGEGYEGHYFWDTEIYMIPFFILTNPRKAKNLLLYRYNKLDQSRKEARNLGYKTGAKIPWRTINGEETSPYYPAGSAQFHINSDIAYAIIKYFEATNDIDFLLNYGFEMLIETARFLSEAVNYVDGEYHLNSVTGPDEYTTVVDDNFYTNKMLEYHFKETVYLYKTHLEKLTTVIKKIDVTEEEIKLFEEISNQICLPFSETLNIFKQDRNFLNKTKVNLADIPKDKYPLLLHYHPLFLYKHQVLKQADTMLALMLLDYDDETVLEDSFNYYEPITTHDSSLSKCIYSIVAYKLQKEEMACDYFMKVLETDIENTHKNTEHGLHVANLGGSYLGFVYGVVGLRIHRGYLKLNPKTNEHLKGYKINIQYQGETVTLTVNESIKIETTGNVTIMLNNELYEVDGVLEY